MLVAESMVDKIHCVSEISSMMYPADWQTDENILSVQSLPNEVVGGIRTCPVKGNLMPVCYFYFTTMQCFIVSRNLGTSIACMYSTVGAEFSKVES